MKKKLVDMYFLSKLAAIFKCKINIIDTHENSNI
jgi:hypothetical protein